MKVIYKNLVIFILFVCFLTGGIEPQVFAANNFTYSSSSLSNNAYNVRLDLEDIKLNFSFNIDWTYENADASIILVDYEGNMVDISPETADRVLTIDVNELLASNTKYTLTLPAGLLKNASNTSDIETNRPITITFTTVSNTLSYSSCIPANKETNVAINLQYVTFSFYNNISIGDEKLFNSIVIKDTLNNVINCLPEIKNNFLQLKIIGDLHPYTSYSVNIPSGALKGPNNTSNGTYELFNNDIITWFTTITDSTRPTVLESQSNSSIIIDANASMVIKFSEKIKLTQDVNKIKLTDSNNNQVAVDVSISQSGDELVVKPTRTLGLRTNYTLYIPKTAIADLYMNYMFSNYTIRYSTGVDINAPQVYSCSITNGQNEVPIGTNEITVIFNEKIKYSTNYGNIELKYNDTNVSLRKSISEDTLTISLSAPLKENTVYTLNIPQNCVKDYTENNFAADFMISFTTKQQPSSPIATPSVQSCAAVDYIELDAGTSFDDAVSYVLPNQVTATLSDKTTAQLGVKWYDSTPDYDEKTPGTYTFKGKIIPSDWILNTRNITATAKVKLVDKEDPEWPDDATVKNTERSSNSVKLLWTEAKDDSFIKEYNLQLEVDGVTKKTVKVSASKAARLSNDISDINYNTLYYTITGLQSSTDYNAYITAVDSQGKNTFRSLQTNFTTYAAVKNTSSSSSNSSSKPTPRPSPKPKPNAYFGDLGGYDWATDAINALFEQGVISGTADGLFSPGATITRADLTVLVTRAFGFRESFEENFDDVDPSSYYYKSVGIAKKLGIVMGDDNNNFFPEQDIKREDIFVIIRRALKAAEIDLYSKGYNSKGYDDYDSVADYAQSSVNMLIDAGIIKGDGTRINPKNHATRAETAVMLSKIIDY